MKFVIKHPTKNSYLRKPRFIGDSVHWTEPNGKPISVQEPWLFATRQGAERTRDMQAVDAAVETWYEAGDRAEPEVRSLEPHRVLGPSNTQAWQQCPPSYVMPTDPMQDFLLGAVLGELIVDSSSDCSGF